MRFPLDRVRGKAIVNPVQTMRFRPARVVAAIALVSGLGLGIAYGCRHFLAWHHLVAAQAAREQKDYPAEHGHLLECLKSWDGNPEIYLQAARSARHLGKFEEAEQFLRRGERLNGNALDVDLEKALLGIARRNPNVDLDSVLEYVWHVPPGHPAVAEILETLSTVYLESYRLLEAKAAVTLWAERDPKNVKALLLRGWVLEHLALNPQAAVPDYQRAVDIEPDNSAAGFRLAEALVKSRASAEALPELEALQRRQPENPAVLLNLALCRQDLGDTREAAALLDQFLLPERLAQLEELSTRLREAQPAPPEVEEAEWYRQVMSLAPYGSQDQPHYVVDLYIQALVERARLLTHDDKYEESFLRRAVKLDPFDYAANYQLLLFLERRGREQEAGPFRTRLEGIREDQKRMSEVMKEVVRDPHNPAPRCVAAEILLRNGQPGEARRWLDSALHEDPNHPGARRLLATYEKLTRGPSPALARPGKEEPDHGGATRELGGLPR